VENLNDTDRFEILRFATETEPCFEKLSDTTKAARDQAQKWIEALKPIGGTGRFTTPCSTHSSYGQRAVNGRSSSSSSPTVSRRSVKPTRIELSRRLRRLEGVELPPARPRASFCFGIGKDVNTHMLDKIVERTRAASQFVLPRKIWK
jgi:hypothetical protein